MVWVLDLDGCDGELFLPYVVAAALLRGYYKSGGDTAYPIHPKTRYLAPGPRTFGSLNGCNQETVLFGVLEGRKREVWVWILAPSDFEWCLLVGIP